MLTEQEAVSRLQRIAAFCIEGCAGSTPLGPRCPGSEGLALMSACRKGYIQHGMPPWLAPQSKRVVGSTVAFGCLLPNHVLFLKGVMGVRLARVAQVGSRIFLQNLPATQRGRWSLDKLRVCLLQVCVDLRGNMSFKQKPQVLKHLNHL